MRFVQNEEIIREKETAFSFFLRLRASQKHEQQRVIDHQHIGREQTFARLLIKTARVLPARFLCADMRFAADLRPYFRVGLDCEIAERTIARRTRPFSKAVQLILLRSCEKLVCLFQRPIEPARAKIILPAFDERRFELDRENLFQDGDVFVEKLLLKIDGVRGDDRFLVLRACE